jgi:Na+/H+ antiporter NhaD/arsenite permease-like protein
MFIGDSQVEDDKPQETIFNKIPIFKPASDPTNIIWENRHIKGFEFLKRLWLSRLVIALILAGACWTIFSLKKTEF